MSSFVRGVLVTMLSTSAGMACVLVDPVPELPKPPRRAPAIVKTALFPDATKPLVQLPTEFVIPVRVPDPGQGFYWAFFVDYNTLNQTQVYSDGDFVPGSSSNPDLYPLRIQKRDFEASVRPDVCHTIEVIVSLDNAQFHSSPAQLTDSVSWWYVPDGSGTCGLFDAGVLDAPIGGRADAGDDAAVQ